MGAKLGWIIAAAILVLAGIVAYVVLNPAHAQPTRLTLAPGVLELQTPEPSAEALLDRPRNAPGDAADAYVAAMIRAEQVYDRLAGLMVRDRRAAMLDGSRPPTADQARALAEVAQSVHQGAQRGRFSFAFEHTPEAIEVGDRRIGQQRALRKVSNVMILAALAATGERDYDRARVILEDLLLMGADFAGERALAPLVLAGLHCQLDAARNLRALHERHLQQADRARAFAALAESVEEVMESYRHKQRILWDLKTLSANPGDVYNIAVHDADRAWRVEAISTLGVLRYRGLPRGDRRRVDELLERFGASDDPYEAAAARSASELTLEQYRSIPSRTQR